jgi:Skp family chaperone for outer membrane proteins
MEEGSKKRVNLSEVAYIGMLVILLGVVIFYMGRPRIGLMDVGRVTRALGIESQVTTEAKEWEARALAEAKRLQQDFDEQTATLRRRMDEAGTAAEKEALQKEMRAANVTLQRDTGAVRERLNAHNREMLSSFRSRLQPFVDRVARRKHLWMILDRGVGVVYAGRQVDVTDEVVQAAKGGFDKEPLLPETNRPPATKE